MSVLQDICEMSVAACRTIFSPVPFLPKLHLEFVDYICLICHSASLRCSDNAEHVWVPLLWFFLFTRQFFSLRSEEFLSAFQDIWEHLRIIISKWSSNEGKGFCQIFVWEPRVLAVMLHFMCLFVQWQTCYRCCRSLTYVIIIVWAQEMQIAQDLLKCILKGLQMSVPKSNYHFLSLNLPFLSTFLQLPMLLEEVRGSPSFVEGDFRLLRKIARHLELSERVRDLSFNFPLSSLPCCMTPSTSQCWCLACLYACCLFVYLPFPPNRKEFPCQDLAQASKIWIIPY